MCRQAVCKKCQGITWRGCGMHVDQVLAGVPKSQRCTCGNGEKNPATQTSGWKRFLGLG